MIKIEALTKENWNDYSKGLQQLENIAEYPYGSDFFKIDHGHSYFSFFQRLGEPLFHIATVDGRIVACASGVIRTIPQANRLIKAWYLCDLKVHPDFRLQRIPAKMFRKNLLWNYLRCQKAYAVSMNPKGKPNRVVEITNRLPIFPISLSTELNIYGLDYDQIRKITPDLNTVLGSFSFLSLSGKKDLVMKSSGAPLKLLHVQHGPMAEDQSKEPMKDFTHMICAPKSSELDKVLNSHFEASASASIVSYGMKKIDWGFVLTSDI